MLLFTLSNEAEGRDDVINVTAIRSIGYPVVVRSSEFGANWVPHRATVQIQDGTTGVIGPTSPERYFGTKYENPDYGHIHILSELKKLTNHRHFFSDCILEISNFCIRLIISVYECNNG